MAPGTTAGGGPRRGVCCACRLRSSTTSWRSPTSSGVGAGTSESLPGARPGRPPRETTASMCAPGSAAAQRAAAAPVLAPKYPIATWTPWSSRSHRVTAVSLVASVPMSNTLARSSSSSEVSKSNSKVPKPASFSCSATWRLRGLCLLLPLPCTNTTMPVAPAGTVRCPASVTPAASTCTCSSRPCGPGASPELLVMPVLCRSEPSRGCRAAVAVPPAAAGAMAAARVSSSVTSVSDTCRKSS